MATATGWIGMDESGKGDYFGPLVIAAVHVTPRAAADLEALNVRDSKKISDGMIKKLAVDIRVLCRHSIVAIGPERYNELYKQRHKGEEDIAVAAASIVARDEFVHRLGRLSSEFGIPLPKGASQAVELAAKSVVRKHGQEGLARVAKLHFKTTKAVLGES